MTADQKVVFIGAGNMTEAIISGVISNQLFQPEQLHVTNRSNTERLAYLKENYNVNISHNMQEIFSGADKIILSIKPKDIQKGLEGIKRYVEENQVLLSVVAGVSTESIQELLDLDIPVIRAMPNTSAAIGRSATALCKGKFATDNHIAAAVSFFETIGTVSVVEEKALHAVTGLSGSGPAYIYYLVEAMETAAINLGLEKDVAKNLVVQTIIGAGEMLKHSPKDPETLRKEVMSPGGTTEAGLQVLSNKNVQEAMIECIERAAKRSEEMGKELEALMIK
jgi:pyrroline-5-carboxylate reductase